MAKKVAKKAKKRQKYQILQNFVLFFYTETTISFMYFDFPPRKHKQFTIKIWKIVFPGLNNCCLNSSQDLFELEAWISWLDDTMTICIRCLIQHNAQRFIAIADSRA